jgi:NAD(P)-dependent dehydrogenase (short-subunit alcohol dehydrogenase family)
VKQGTGGSIVITGSVASFKALGGPTGGGEGYIASKHAILGLTKAFATTYAPHSIRVNSVHPAGVATPMMMNETLMKFLQDNPDLIGASPNLLPVQVLESADITNAIAFLCSDEARYITGVALPVDAGLIIA